MKKFLLFLSLFLFAFTQAGAEAIRLKNGVIINGSIISRTEYVLTVKTAHGTISINQREVDAILPDLHRVLLKGGGEYVGTVLDLDEFNLSLKTDKGVVNIDVASISSMEIYDYGEAEKQQKYIEKKKELEQEALASLPKSADASQAAAVAAGGSLSTSGLSFDSDLEKVFPSKPVEVAPEQHYNYRLHTFQGEEIKEEAAQEEKPLAPILDEEETIDQSKKKDNSKHNFALNAGIINTALKLNLSKDGGPAEFDMGGTAVAFGASYMRRLTSHFWAGGAFSFGLVPIEYITINNTPGSEVEMKASGQVIDIDLFLNYYINPKSDTRFYLLGGLGYNMLNIEKNKVENTGTMWVTAPTANASASGFSFLGGAGVERSIQDINVGLEIIARKNSYGGDLSGSRDINYFVSLKASWFF